MYHFLRSSLTGILGGIRNVSPFSFQKSCLPRRNISCARPNAHLTRPNGKAGRANVFWAGTVWYRQEVPTKFTLYPKSMQNITALKDMINLPIFYHY